MLWQYGFWSFQTGDTKDFCLMKICISNMIGAQSCNILKYFWVVTLSTYLKVFLTLTKKGPQRGEKRSTLLWTTLDSDFLRKVINIQLRFFPSFLYQFHHLILSCILWLQVFFFLTHSKKTRKWYQKCGFELRYFWVIPNYGYPNSHTSSIPYLTISIFA